MTTKYINKAARYRKETGRSGGVVVLYGKKVSGWMNTLRDPAHWAPGCIAVDADNAVFEAIGGDYYNGALAWQRINPS